MKRSAKHVTARGRSQIQQDCILTNVQSVKNSYTICMAGPKYDILTVQQFKEMYQGAKKMVDLGIDDEAMVSDQVEDTKKLAVKFGIVGAGQGGGQLADAFYQIGYRRVAVVNTTIKDMQRLSVPEPNRLVLQSEGGAGKDPNVGKLILEANVENVISLIKNSFRSDVEHILICVGGGGGTGTGAVIPLIKICQEYLTSLGVQNVTKKVGVICTLPTKDESPAVQRNALEVLMPLCDMAEKGMLSPLVLIDNARVLAMYGKASVIDVWNKANKNVASLFNSFNECSAVESEQCHVVFDPKDYKSVLEGGMLAFGRTKLDKVEKLSDVADAVRSNVTKGLLVEGMDLSKANMGAGLLVSSAEGLGSVSQDALECAFASLNRLMDKNAKLHRGVYEAGDNKVFLYTILSGMGRPLGRLSEIQSKAGSNPIG